MQIQLKQSEIVEALKQYIVTKGISLAGKTVEVGFTAGRTPTGLTSEITIEDAELVVDPAITGTFNRAVPELGPIVAQQAVTKQEPEQAALDVANVVDSASVTKKASSLFN